MLWHDLKQDGYSQKISNMAELQIMKKIACWNYHRDAKMTFCKNQTAAVVT